MFAYPFAFACAVNLDPLATLVQILHLTLTHVITGRAHLKSFELIQLWNSPDVELVVQGSSSALADLMLQGRYEWKAGEAKAPSQS